MLKIEHTIYFAKGHSGGWEIVFYYYQFTLIILNDSSVREEGLLLFSLTPMPSESFVTPIDH